MKEYDGFALTALNWAEARDQAKKVNPEFAALVDELEPDDSCKLYHVKYPYGAQFLQSGEFFLPGDKGQLVPFVDIDIPTDVKDDLSYKLNTNPVSMVLHNSIEMYMTLEDRIIPFSISGPGSIFGLWRVLDQPGEGKLSHTSVFMWDMTAGARSIFMLPKISEALAHNKLKQAMHISIDKPRDLLDHWRVFKEIAAQPDFAEPWYVEMFFFSKQWFERMLEPKWIKLYQYLLDKTWRSTEFWRNQFVWNLTFTRIQSMRKIKASAYIADIIKHIFAIGTGAVPGFQPALDNSLAPVSGLQQAYLDHYELKNYAPIMMVPHLFTACETSGAVYYSLQFPTALELSPKTSGRSSAISDLYDVRSLINKYLTHMKHESLNIEATPLYELSRAIHFDYYHSNVELYEGMKASEQLIEDDPIFAEVMKKFPGREFPKNSAFVKGVIGIHR